METHSVVSIIQLEQARPDPYQREIPHPEAIIVEGKNQCVIERIVQQENRNTKRCQKKTWESASFPQQDVPDVVEKFEKTRSRKC